MRNFTRNRFPIKNLLIDSLLFSIIAKRQKQMAVDWFLESIQKH